MKKRFLKYAVFAVVVTYGVLLISMSLKTKLPKVDIKGINSRRVSANSIMSEKTNKDAEEELIAEGTYFTPVLNNDGTKMLYSDGDNVFELDLVQKNTKQLTKSGNCYNPTYNPYNNNIIAFARTDGIYIIDTSKNKIKALVDTNNTQVSFAKPNFTDDDAIIYYRVSTIPKSNGHGFIEKNPAIYKISLNGKNELKLVDGYNPQLSKDGKNLLYEWKDNLCLLNLNKSTTKVVDSGKYACFSNNGKFISYAKYERDTAKYKNNNKLYVDKEYSNIYIVETGNLKKKFKITKEVFENRDVELESWANAVKNYDTEQHFLVVSKMSYFDTVWSKNDNSIYISLYNADKGNFELIKYKINERQK